MKKEELKDLLEKYYNGESTLEEERLLRDYFRGENIYEGFEADREIFGFYSASPDMSEPSMDLEERIIKKINGAGKTGGKAVMRRIYIISTGIAAAVMLIAALYFFIMKTAEPEDTFSDPALAYAETIKILNEISAKFNEGTRALTPVTKFESATRLSMESISKSASIMSAGIKPVRNMDKLSVASDTLHR